MRARVKRLAPQARPPERQSPGAAGFDLFAAGEVIIPPGCRALVPLGIAVEFPKGYAALLWDRSGLALKHGVTVLAGVIDSDYRGEWMVVLFNTGDADFQISVGDRVVQVLFQSVAEVGFVEVSELPSAQRGVGGFGSTGST